MSKTKIRIKNKYKTLSMHHPIYGRAVLIAFKNRGCYRKLGDKRRLKRRVRSMFKNMHKGVKFAKQPK